MLAQLHNAILLPSHLSVICGAAAVFFFYLLYCLVFFVGFAVGRVPCIMDKREKMFCEESVRDTQWSR